MRKHTKEFKNSISTFGRQLDNKITIIETNSVLEKDDLYSITPVTNADLLKSVMKEVDFESKQQISVGQEINVKSGVMVNGEYEYIDFGNYFVYKSEYKAETMTYSHICYDKMLNTMIDYVPLDTTYPISLREYIGAIATKCGLEFANKNGTFANYDTMINEDHFSNGNYTFRDVLDYVAQIVGGWLCINDKGELEVRYPEMARNYGNASGENVSFTTDVSDKVSKIVVYGKSVQETSTNPVMPSPDYPSEIECIKGKNLWQNSDYLTNLLTGKYVIKNGGFTFTRGDITGGKYIAKKIKVEKGKTYTFSASSNSFGTNNFYICIYRTNVYGTLVKSNIANFLTYTATATEELLFTFIIGSAITSVSVSEIQVEMDNEKTDYIPYNNIQIKDVGKNLVNPTLQSYTKNGVTFTKNEDGTYTLNGTSTAGMDNHIRTATDRIKVYKDKFYKLSVKEFGGTKSGNASANVRLVIGTTNTWAWLVSSGNARQPSDDGYIDIVNYYIEKNAIFNNYKIGIQLEIVDNASSSSTEWEQYKSNSVNIDLQGNELCSLPNDIKDELVIENDRAKIIKKVGRVVLNGSETNLYILSSGLFRYNISSYNSQYILCNHFTNKIDDRIIDNETANKYMEDNQISARTGNFKDRFYIKSSQFSTLADFKTWLSSNNITVYYELATPEEIDLGAVILPETFEGINNVSLVATLDTNMSITYTTNYEEFDKHFLKDVNVSFTKKYGAINSVVFSRGGNSDNIYRKDNTSVSKNGLTEIKISDNPFLEGDDRENFIQAVFDKLNGLEFYLLDVASTGIMYMELGDLYYFNMIEEKPSLKSGLVKSGMRKAQGSSGGKHICLLMNDEIKITQGLEESIYTDEPVQTETDYKTSAPTDNSIKNAIIQTNKNSAEILLKVNDNEIISAINLSPEKIKINSAKLDIDAIATFTNSKLAEAGSTVINGANITTGSINCDRLNGGTINGQAIRGGSISITTGNYYFNMGTATSNPNCSGLNVGYYGIKAYSDITATGFAITDSDTGKTQSINIYDGHGKVWYLTFTGGILTASEYK